MMGYILSVRDFKKKWVNELFKEADIMLKIRNGEIEDKDLKYCLSRLAKVSFFFHEPSTRTRKSFKEAAEVLGFRVDGIVGGRDSSIAKGESIIDTVRMMGKNNQGADIIIMRTKLEGASRFAQEILFQENCNTKVINGGDGVNQHPTQALLDFWTIRNHFGWKNIPKLTMGFVGDLETSRVVHSDLELAGLLGVKKIRLVSMPEARAPDKYKRSFDDVIEGDSLELLSDCDVIIALRVQKERITDSEKLNRILGKFRITKESLKLFKRTAIIMHPLPNPKDRGEIDPGIYNYKDGPKVVVHEQAAGGIPTRMQMLLGAYNSCFINPLYMSESIVKAANISKESIKECLKRQKEKNSGKAFKYFRPISRGTIIDHIPVGYGSIVVGLLDKSLEFGTPVHLLRGIPSKKYNTKDVLVLENQFIDNNKDFLAAISCLYGPRLTMHVIKKSYRKFKIEEPDIICRLLRCPNPNCVTNHEPEARTEFRKIESRNGIVECKYCEREFTGNQLKIFQ